MFKVFQFLCSQHKFRGHTEDSLCDVNKTSQGIKKNNNSSADNSSEGSQRTVFDCAFSRKSPTIQASCRHFFLYALQNRSVSLVPLFFFFFFLTFYFFIFS